MPCIHLQQTSTSISQGGSTPCNLNSKDQSKNRLDYRAGACPPISPKKQVPLLTIQGSLHFQRKMPQCLYSKQQAATFRGQEWRRQRKESALPQQPEQSWSTQGRGAKPGLAVVGERSRAANSSGQQGLTAHSRHRPNATWSSTEPQGARETTGQWQGPLHGYDEGHRAIEGKHKIK